MPNYFRTRTDWRWDPYHQGRSAHHRRVAPVSLCAGHRFRLLMMQLLTPFASCSCEQCTPYW